MTKEKQIEEMAKYCCNPCEFESNGECVLCHPIGGCEIATETAKAFYNAGYRLAAEVAGEIFVEIKQEIKLALDSNYKARGKLLRKFPQEHNEIFMGSLNGKIDALRGIDDFIAELKKKFT